GFGGQGGGQGERGGRGFAVARGGRGGQYAAGGGIGQDQRQEIQRHGRGGGRGFGVRGQRGGGGPGGSGDASAVQGGTRGAVAQGSQIEAVEACCPRNEEDAGIVQAGGAGSDGHHRRAGQGG